MNAQQHIEEAYNCISARYIIIRLQTECSDHDDVVKFLRRKLPMLGARLHIGRHYSCQYVTPICFTLIGGSPNFHSFKDRGFIVDNMGYLVNKHTTIKLENHFNIQPVELLIGYDTELKPLQTSLSTLFVEKNYEKKLFQQLDELSVRRFSSDLVSRFNVLKLENGENQSADNFNSSSVASQKSSSRSPSEMRSDTLEATDSDVDQMMESYIILCPEGCGKSTLLKRLEANYPSVVFSKSKNLNSLIQLANSKKPCLFLIDDLDQMKNANSLATALDSLRDVLVVGTATSMSGVLPELRKPGRLTALVSLAKPTEKMRRDILNTVNSTGNEQGEGGDIIDAIVTATHGCSTRELLELLMATKTCEEEDKLAMIRKYRPSQEAGQSLESHSGESGRCAQKVLKEITVVGYASLLQQMEEKFNFSLHHSLVFKSMNLPLPSKILLFGPSGCGKSHLVKYFAHKFSLPLKSVDRADVFGKYFGDSEKNLNNIFDAVMNTVPSILHFPSFEGLASVRNEGDHDVEGRVVNLLKARLDGVIKLEGLFVIAETSKPEMLDSNIIRAGRFSSYLHADLPSDGDRLEALRYFLRDFSGEVNEETLCEDTKGCTMAEIKVFCQAMLKGSPLGSIPKDVKPKELAKINAFAERFKQH